ncbi:MAG: ATP-dependent sacrificial sulfur transferase LarE [Lentisphaeria bacterium]|nr:ATP-dependent sacrificial sulfur transferase LarE [Lentisphaeria bacterium]
MTIEALKEKLTGFDSVLVAFSGGCDSTFLAAVAREVLGDRCLAVTIHSSFTSRQESERVDRLVKRLGIRHQTIHSDVLANEAVQKNPTDRCYHCKTMLFKKLLQIAAEEGMAVVCDGSNVDDRGDYRPGRKALRELGVVSPLEECGFSKADIRRLSKIMDLPTWDLPAAACLASRIPYGDELTESKLRQVEQAEEALADLGFSGFRVRHHGDMARLELSAADIAVAAEKRDIVAAAIHRCGYTFVTLDLDGYRMGSLNPV